MPRLGFGLGPGDGQRGRVAGIDFVGPALPPGASLARASIGYWSDAGGVLRAAPVDAPRFDYDAAGAAKGLLIEAAASNFLPWSVDVAGHWGVDAGGSAAIPVITAAAAAAPDGSITASRIDFTRGNGYARVSLAAAQAVAGRGVFSAWLRADASGPNIALRLDGVATGTLTLGPVWRRVSIASAAIAPGADAQILLWSALSDAPPTASAYVWGLQLENGDAPSSMIPTQGVPAARAADRLAIDAVQLGLGDGPARLRLILDDGSAVVRDVVASGGRIAVPADLPRPWLRRIERA